VFGTPVSGALFGIEVLSLGALDYTLIFPALVAGIVAHLTCGVQPPFPVIQTALNESGRVTVVMSIVSGAIFGLVALALIELLRGMQRVARRFEKRPLLLAAAGGAALVILYTLAGNAYAGLGTPTIDAALSGTAEIGMFVFLMKILVTGITLESGGSGGIITPVFFIGATSGAALGQLTGLSPSAFAGFGFVSVLAAAANTPIAAAVMAIEILPRPDSVYAALSAVTAFLIVGHRSVYASQKLGISKSGGLEIQLGAAMGDFDASSIRVREGTLTARLHRVRTSPRDDACDDPGDPQPPL
jgi:H+/Cl- antiporter ClcA